MNENEDKNLEDKRLANLQPVPFTTENQPTPEAKKKGWERRREAQGLLDLIQSMGDMSYKDVKALIDDVAVHPENHTLKEVKIAQYLMKEKFTVDYLDRHISKAPTQTDITSQGEKISAVEVKIIDSKDEITDTGDKGTSEDNSGRKEG
jgi:hypothetical protein